MLVWGALEWTRTTTPLQAQALNLLRIPFRHEGWSQRITQIILYLSLRFVNDLSGLISVVR